MSHSRRCEPIVRRLGSCSFVPSLSFFFFFSSFARRCILQRKTVNFLPFAAPVDRSIMRKIDQTIEVSRRGGSQTRKRTKGACTRKVPLAVTKVVPHCSPRKYRLFLFEFPPRSIRYSEGKRSFPWKSNGRLIIVGEKDEERRKRRFHWRFRFASRFTARVMLMLPVYN